jgi:ABC-2 type transport system ATP-binding protein/lipopolysaccharide transport system ATP-binding protein
MAHVSLQSVSLHFPIYSSNSRSFRKSIINLTTGGVIKSVNQKAVAIHALEDINLELKDGDRLGLIGHNGAGKSTLLKTIAGVYSPTAGKMKVRGKLATLLNISLGMEDEATGYENIRTRGLVLGLKRKQIEQVVPDIEEFCELGNYLSMPVKTYSSGMRLRLAFAISTCIEPEILLLDEVIGVGDAKFTQKAEARIKQIIDKANILVLASHSNKTIRDVCNKAILLCHGKIVAFGGVEEVMAQYC